MRAAKLFSILFISLVLYSCSKESSDDEISSFTLQVEVQSVTDRAASITWNKPEGSNISYKIYLNNELIEDNFGLTAYTFTRLVAETHYSGKITATDGSKTTSVNFSFNTEEYVAKIYDGGAYLYSQQGVNDFGSHHYNEIRYDLYIDGSNITDLSPLYDLKKVNGKVEINRTSVQTLQGLESLEYIGGKLIIFRCDVLDNLDALENLKTINNDIEIYSNGLSDINGLRNLENFSKGVGIGYNQIVNVNIINDATSLHHLSFVGNEKLETVTGFQNVLNIEDYVDIWINPKLISLQGLRNITTVGGIFNLEENTDLATIDFVNLTSIGSHMSLWENQGLNNLDGFSNLTSVGREIYIINHHSLSDLCGVSTAVLNNTTEINISGNQYNPTIEDFQNGSCRQ